VGLNPDLRRENSVPDLPNCVTAEVCKGKVIPVTGRGGLYGCETFRLTHFLDNQLTDGCEVVSIARQAIPLTGRGGP
jgi:hypothetical protein